MLYFPGENVGPYQILSRIGEGGMGEVYKARDTRLDRFVAIKRLKTPNDAQFTREARAIAALNSPHICQIFDIGPDYLVLEFVEGFPLHGPLPAEQALTLFLQIVAALETAHHGGILHRDLKPENILVTQSGVKLLDFGLAKLRANADRNATQTLPGMIMGTAAFMSPEQAQGKDLDERSDLFSFGATLYTVLCGRNAFGGSSLLETMNSVVYGEPAPIDSPLGPVVMRCLQKDPAKRFQSAAELKAALLVKLEGPSPVTSTRSSSIAVLPFVNISGDKEQEYFGDGLAEDIINALVKVPGLKVIARTSAFAFKGRNVDMRDIAKALDVAHVLEGSIRRSGNRIRVTAQLIAAEDGTHLWSERYDRELADIFEIQDDLSTSIASTLTSKLTPAAARRQHVPKVAAHDALMKARYLQWRLTPEAVDRAQKLFEESLSIDPQYSLAHAVYAGHLHGRALVGLTPAHKAIPLARRLAERALELDPSIQEAHVVLFTIAADYDYDWIEAERRLALASQAGAASGWAQCEIAQALFGGGRTRQAFERFERALQDDPLHLVARSSFAVCLGALGRYQDAEEHVRYALDLDADFRFGYHVLADLYAAQEMFDVALPFSRKAYDLGSWKPHHIGQYAALLALCGERGTSEAVLKNMPAAENYSVPTGWATYHLLCRNLEAAANWFEKAFEQRQPDLGLWLQSANAARLRASEYWPRLAKLMNLRAF